MSYIEHEDITLKMIIKAGVLPAGTILHAASNSEIHGILNVDGSITLIVDGKKKVYPYPSGAARAIRKVSVNGWLFWRIKQNDEFIELSKIKKKYLEDQLGDTNRPVTNI